MFVEECLLFVIVAYLENGRIEEQCVCIKFCSNWVKNSTETAYCLKWLMDSRQWEEHMFLLAFKV